MFENTLGRSPLRRVAPADARRTCLPSIPAANWRNGCWTLGATALFVARIIVRTFGGIDASCLRRSNTYNRYGLNMRQTRRNRYSFRTKGSRAASTGPSCHPNWTRKPRPGKQKECRTYGLSNGASQRNFGALQVCSHCTGYGGRSSSKGYRGRIGFEGDAGALRSCRFGPHEPFGSDFDQPITAIRRVTAAPRAFEAKKVGHG